MPDDSPESVDPVRLPRRGRASSGFTFSHLAHAIRFSHAVHGLSLQGSRNQRWIVNEGARLLLIGFGVLSGEYRYYHSGLNFTSKSFTGGRHLNRTVSYGGSSTGRHVWVREFEC